MKDSATIHQCPRCGAALAGDAPEGLCPRCLAALHLGPVTVFTPGAEAGARTSPSPEELAPHFPGLEILECLGRGGMGVVYKARQKSLNRLVALKLLAPERAGDAAFAERFTREAHALAALNHPHIVTVHDFGRAGGFYFLLMEFVDGVNLRQAMNARRFTPEQALAIVPPVCEALQFAHERGIVHRDIKPENLLLDKEGRVKIADFGIAKMLGDESRAGLAASQPAGTPQYMAPEQKAPHGADHRADIYSLGVVLYEMLTGERPTEKIEAPSKRAQVDAQIDEIVLRALERKPELRFATAAEFRTQVEMAAKEAAGKALRSKAEMKATWRKFIFFELLGIGIIGALLAWCWLCRTNPGSVEEGSLIILAGLVCYAYGVPMWLRMAHTGSYYDLRTPKSRLSEERSYEINVYAGRRLVTWCWFAIAVGVFVFFQIPESSAWSLPLGLYAPYFLAAYVTRRWVRENDGPGSKQWSLLPLAAIERGGAIILCGAFVYLFVVQPYRVRTDEFSPALKPGDFCALWKIGRVTRGDVVAYEWIDGETFLGRVMASSRKDVVVDGYGIEKREENVWRSRVVGKLSRAKVRAAALFPGAVAAETNSLGQKFAPVGDVEFCIWPTRIKDFGLFAKDVELEQSAWMSGHYGIEQAPEHPVVNVSWDEAVAFCKWLTDKEHEEGVLPAKQYYRLPTDLEWSKAVGLPVERGKTPEERDGRIADVYPWGNGWPPPAGAGNYNGDETRVPGASGGYKGEAIGGYNDGFPWTSPVGSFRPNRYGLYDIGGNVWQWCMDSWNAGSKDKVLRGGSWTDGNPGINLLSSTRLEASPDSRADNYGFRIVKATKGLREEQK